MQYGQPAKRVGDQLFVGDAVHLQHGENFFAPSMTFFNRLAAGWYPTEEEIRVHAYHIAEGKVAGVSASSNPDDNWHRAAALMRKN